MGWIKRNIEKTKNRNGASTQGRTIVKYITQTGTNGVSGDDAFNVYITPQAKIFNAGPVSQTDTIFVYAFRGTNQLGTYVDASAILGEDDGLTCTVSNNGTVNTSVTVTVSNTLDSDGGTIVIPVKYATDTYDASTVYDASLWDASIHTFADTSTYYSWTLVKATSSAWNLDLTNENASINANADGDIYASAVRPTCTAKLTRGTEDVSTALYYIDTNDSNYSSKSPQDVSINPTSGVMTFGSGFTFTGLGLEIPIYAKVDNVEKARKIMTVTKSLAGADGIARTYWLDLSADSIKVDQQNVCHPTSITAQVWKQENESNPTTTNECVIKWCYNSPDASLGANTYSSAITVDASKDYMTFKLYKDSSYFGESETVPILKDGKNGTDGTDGTDGRDGEDGADGSVGPAGPAIRGPILWNTNLRRRFCSGSGTGATDSSYIDIIYYDPSGGVNYHYYVCQESYTQSNNLHYWSDVYPRYWSQAQGEYEFIATQLLLANNAKIKFLTNNEFYLTDADGNIHGGGRAANNDSSVIFWAGSAEGSMNINAAPFQVDVSGNITAQSGTFGGYIQMKYIDMSDLEVQHTTGSPYYSYTLDTRAYVVLNGGNIGDVKTVKLPVPNASRNGFVYYFLVLGKRLGIYTSTEGVCCFVEVADGSLKILDYVYQPYGNSIFDAVGLYGGKYQFVCANVDGTYKWLLTEATGGAQMRGTIYDGNGQSHTNSYRTFRPVFGFIDAAGTPAIKNIVTVSEMPSTTDVNTMYVVTQN